jgi:hypothetical protein
MPRYFAYVVISCLGLAALGCGDNDSETSPTSPQFAPGATGCELSTAKSLVNSVFATSTSRQAANGYLQTIQNNGSGTLTATNAGFDVFALIAAERAADRPAPPVNGSTFIKAVLSCMDVGTLPSSLDFTGALGESGAFEVRGGSATDASLAVTSYGDPVWGLEPPLVGTTRKTWDQITVQPADVETRRFLAYGAPVAIAPTAFTNEVLVGNVFDWSTVPTLTFSDPGVVVGTCVIDDQSSFLIQHLAKSDNEEIVPSDFVSFCGLSDLMQLTSAKGWTPSALAQRLVDFFTPRPLLAAALGTRPPGGSVGALSPFGAVNPDTITLSFPTNAQVKDGFTNTRITFKDGSDIRVFVEPKGGTDLNGAVVVLSAVANLGAPVVPKNNTAVTIDGLATFPGLELNKAGGYRLVAKINGFGQNDATGFTLTQAISNGFNLKQRK